MNSKPKRVGKKHSGSKTAYPRVRRRFPRQPRCRVCKRKVEFGNLCYYCRKRRTS